MMGLIALSVFNFQIHTNFGLILDNAVRRLFLKFITQLELCINGCLSCDNFD